MVTRLKLTLQPLEKRSPGTQRFLLCDMQTAMFPVLPASPAELEPHQQRENCEPASSPKGIPLPGACRLHRLTHPCLGLHRDVSAPRVGTVGVCSSTEPGRGLSWATTITVPCPTGTACSLRPGISYCHGYGRKTA